MHDLLRLSVFLLLSLVLYGCSTAPSPKQAPVYQEIGMASYYAHKFNGRKTASGERYDENKMTAAHRRLAFGTIISVKDLESGRSVVVRINDRGPYVKGRIVDLSYAAAKKLDMIRRGVIRVRISQAK